MLPTWKIGTGIEQILWEILGGIDVYKACTLVINCLISSIVFWIPASSSEAIRWKAECFVRRHLSLASSRILIA
jgi:hypothetical protein